MSSLFHKFNFAKKLPNYTIVFDGNSWFEKDGTGTPGGQNVPYRVNALLTASGRTTSYLNYGVSGQTIDQMQSDAVSQIDSKVSTHDILVGLELVNQWGLNTGQSKETIYGKYKQYFIDRKTAGFKYLIAVTPTHQGYYARTGWDVAGRYFTDTMLTEFPQLGINVVNTWDIPELQDWTNLTYFLPPPDKIHKTAAGEDLEALAIYNTIIRL